MDQFFWNETVYRLDAGPKGMDIGHFDQEHLEPRLLDLWENLTFRAMPKKFPKSCKKKILARKYAMKLLISY